MRSAAPVAALALCAACVPGPRPAGADRGGLGALETNYQAAQFWDDRIRLAESLGVDTIPEGLPLAAARESLAVYTAEVQNQLLLTSALELSPEDARARAIVAHSALAESHPEAGSATADSTASPGCDTDPRTTAAGPDALRHLTRQTFACYGDAAGVIVVDGDTLNRLGILGLLGRTDDPARRARLFQALEPVWRSVNGDNGARSPYRLLLRLRRAEWGDSGSPIEAKGPAFGLAPRELDRWLVMALSHWRALMPDTLLEPWDWYYLTGEASRRLSPGIQAVADLRRINRAYYRQLGADPDQLNVHFDLDVRPGKYPVAYTDFGSHRRWAGGRMQPAEPWVFTSYRSGGLDNLAELLHETGHAIHVAAVDTRSAYNDWPDNDTFTEALADLPAMELYEPVWQFRFLGDSVPLKESLRAKYASVMFDMAWALFELRVHREPDADPNVIWSGITREFLGIRPHPEWSWWAMRGQLVDGPGYLVNYALGAFIVADMRHTIHLARGDGAWTDPRLYAWLSERVYRFGLERPSRDVLEQFLGHRLQPTALLTDLERIGK